MFIMIWNSLYITDQKIILFFQEKNHRFIANDSDWCDISFFRGHLKNFPIYVPKNDFRLIDCSKEYTHQHQNTDQHKKKRWLLEILFRYSKWYQRTSSKSDYRYDIRQVEYTNLNENVFKIIYSVAICIRNCPVIYAWSALMLC